MGVIYSTTNLPDAQNLPYCMMGLNTRTVTRHELVFPWHSLSTVPGRITNPRSNGLSLGYDVTLTLNPDPPPSGRRESVSAPWVHVRRDFRRRGFISGVKCSIIYTIAVKV